tara:strand:- start:1937 stop:3100 length:1164 start_codon:yes stop_codon:yes gene_type:complete
LRYPRIDLSILNSLLSISPFSKVNKGRFSSKIHANFDSLNLDDDLKIESIVSDYVDHLNSDLFTPLGRRLHSILSSESLAEGVRFSRTVDSSVDGDRAPVIVIGLPRSGTTNLHNFIINNFDLSGINFWELSSPSRVFANKVTDEKFRRIKSAFGFYLYRYLAPSIQSMHRVNMDTYEECWHFQKHFFLCYNYVIQLKFLKLEDFLLSTDTSIILDRYSDFMCQVNGSNKTALKCPDHMMFLPDIVKTFPESKIIWIHRDPLDSITSYCPMIESVWNLFFGGENKSSVGDFIIDLYSRMLRKTISDRDTLNLDIIDVSFKDLISSRRSLAEKLSKEIKLPLVEKDPDKKPAKFFKNKYKFNRDEYGVSNDIVDRKLRFYKTEYSKYL